MRLQDPPSNHTMHTGYEHMTLMLYADGFSVGDQKSGLICPFCHGGATKERSLSIRAFFDGVNYKCFRASCGKSGKLNLKTGFLSEDKDKNSNVTELPWVKAFELVPITKDWEDELLKYGILKSHAVAKGWQCNVVGNLVIPLKPVMAPVVVGHEFRNKDGRLPKSRMHMMTGALNFPRNAFETKHKKETVLIVEDSISALKASIVCRTYSLQGTNFSQRHAEELADNWKAKRYLLALDRDATQKSVEFLNKYKFILPAMRLCPINRDIKNFRVSEIEELVKSYE